jgi:hypothetical protein
MRKVLKVFLRWGHNARKIWLQILKAFEIDLVLFKIHGTNFIILPKTAKF